MRTGEHSVEIFSLSDDEILANIQSSSSESNLSHVLDTSVRKSFYQRGDTNKYSNEE